MEHINIVAAQAEFLAKFEKDWTAFLVDCEPHLSKACQLHIGNHMRPQLAFWGYMISPPTDNSHKYNEISSLAVSIEAVHKASVIIDDIIDGDTKRRGQPCMHTEHGEYPTVFFAVCMLAKAISQMKCIFPTSESAYAQMVRLLCETIHAMCTGAIQEITAPQESQINLGYIQDIIDRETAQLIKNSLYMGYLLSGNAQAEVGDAICTIGAKCGFLFQVMNDLEPFCNPDYVTQYKGNLNADFLRTRKSIVLPYLYRECSVHDKKILLDTLGKPESFGTAKKLFDYYHIQEIIDSEVEDVYISVAQLLHIIATAGHLAWAKSFSEFTENLQRRYKTVLRF